MKKILIALLIIQYTITISAQIVDCGQRTTLAAVEDQQYSLARGSLDGTGWKFAKLYNFDQPVAESISLGITTNDEYRQDTIYILYPDVISPTLVEYKGQYQAVYPWSYTYDEPIRRDMCAAIPVRHSEELCPDTVWTSFELWYSSEGYARYKARGARYAYSNLIDSIEMIVEEKIQQKSCIRLRQGEKIKARSKRDIVIRRGYCKDSEVNENDVLIVERGEILEYKGCTVDGDVITMKSDANFKIRFAPGSVNLKKVDAGGRIEFISNTSWQ